MKKAWMSLSVALALAACAVEANQDDSRAPQPMPASGATRPDSLPKRDLVVPANFSRYAVGPRGQCVAGALLDADGLNQRPFVYLSEQSSATLRWGKTLPLPVHTYQGRATHCLMRDGALYVLVQSDTQPEQTLSQTLLRAVRIDPRNGAVVAEADIQPAGVAEAHSAWVEEGADNFRLHDRALVIAGRYYRLSAPENRKSFLVELDTSFD